MKVIGKKYGIEITKPWSREMYEHNDMVANLIKIDLYKTLNQLYDDGVSKDKLNDFISSMGGIRYGQGYGKKEMYDSIYQEILNAPNYMLDEGLDYLIKKSYINEPKYRFVGYDK